MAATPHQIKANCMKLTLLDNNNKKNIENTKIIKETKGTWPK
jgi:hypothetical protein